jgi:hypothetical protein
LSALSDLAIAQPIESTDLPEMSSADFEGVSAQRQEESSVFYALRTLLDFYAEMR